MYWKYKMFYSKDVLFLYTQALSSKYSFSFVDDILTWSELILFQLPKGTHQWSSFLTPEELVLILERASISVSPSTALY